MDANQSAISDDEIDTGFGDLAPAPKPEPEIATGPTTAEIAAAAAAEAAAQPAIGHEVNQPAQAVQSETRLAQDHGTFIDLGNGDKIVRTDDGGVRLQPAPEKPLVDTRQELSPRALTKRELEFEAGRKAVARHEEMERQRPKSVKTKAEIESEGRNTPVFRPGDFQEYRDLKAGAVSKDAGSQAGLPAPDGTQAQ